MTDEEQMFQFMMKNNLDWIASFHNHVDAILKEKVKEIPKYEDVSKENKIFWKHVYETNFPARLRETTFLLMFGYLEEMIYLLWRDNNINNIPLDRGYGILRFKSYIKSVLGTELGSCSEYQHILDAQKVRNALLHIAGRVSLSKDKETLEKIISKNSEFYTVNLDRVEISNDGLLHIQRAIRNMTKKLFNKINRIDC